MAFVSFEGSGEKGEVWVVCQWKEDTDLYKKNIFFILNNTIK